jgi:glycosyltransferase involved in cell wall biosynthesis
VDKIYVVDDGSKDKTTEIVRSLTADVNNATYNKVIVAIPSPQKNTNYSLSAG